MNKLYLSFSIIFILIPVLLSSYTILAFLPTYFSANHEFKPGATFIYYGIPFGELELIDTSTTYLIKLNLTYLGSNTFLTHFTLYNATYATSFYHGVEFNFIAKNITILYSTSEILSYENSSLIRLLFPSVSRDVTILSNLTLIVNKSPSPGFFTQNPFGIASPEKYVGFAAIYVGYLGDANVTHYFMNFVRYNNHYALVDFSSSQIPILSQLIVNTFGSNFPTLQKLYNEDLAVIKERGIVGQVLNLNYTNVMPEQASFLSIFIYNFNYLFPISYALVVIGLALLVIGVRRG